MNEYEIYPYFSTTLSFEYLSAFAGVCVARQRHLAAAVCAAVSEKAGCFDSEIKGSIALIHLHGLNYE